MPWAMPPISVSLFLDSRAYAKRMAVGMHDVTLPDAPGFIHRRLGHYHVLLQRELITGIDLGWRRQKPTHPNPTRIVSHVPRHRATARSLAVLAEEDLAFSTAPPPKSGGSPQSQPFFQPSFSNQAKLSSMLDTLRIGIRRSTFLVSTSAPEFTAIVSSYPQITQITQSKKQRAGAGGARSAPPASLLPIFLILLSAQSV